MPTSSIFHNVIIDDPETAERFLNALEESEEASRGKPIGPGYPVLRDPDEIRKLLARRKKLHG